MKDSVKDSTKEAGKTKVKSLIEEWKQVLRYGIEDEVLEAIKNIRTAKETSLNSELKTLFVETISINIKLSVIDYFINVKAPDLAALVLTILKQYENSDDIQGGREMVLAGLRYFMSIESYNDLELFKAIANDDDKGLAATAIKLLGKTHDSVAGIFLLEKLNDVEFDGDLKPEVVLALGELAYKDAVEPLIGIIEDKNQEKILRMYACDALGKIGDPQAVPALKAIFSEEDALIKSYAASALSAFKEPEVVDILIQGLKDVNWKVRITAAKGLATLKADNAMDILIYKAEKDPAQVVREEAMRAIGELGAKQGFELLRTMYTSEKQNLTIRDLALSILIEKDLNGTVEVIRELVKKELSRPFPREEILAATGARLCTVKDNSLKEIFTLLLASPNVSLKIYGIRGIGYNRFGDLKANLEKIANEDPVKSVKQTAVTALEKW